MPRPRVWLVAALAAAAPATGLAQEDLTARVDSVFAEWDRDDSPGCAVGVVRAGRLVYAKGYGMADLDRGIALTPEHVFYLASVSKQFTAASIALLALDGAVSLDASVRRYLPELPEYADGITVRHLVHHTSGLRDYLVLMQLARYSLEKPWTAGEILSLITRQTDGNFAPGARYLYSNTGYFLLPLIVERVSGESIRAFAQRRIFDPLGMTDTHFHDDYRHEVAPRAMSYRRTEDGDVEPAFLEYFDQVGSGGVLSTVKDLAKWDRNFYEPSVGGPELLELLHTPGVLSDGDTLDYAFGLGLDDYKGLRSVAHGGSMMGFRTHLLRLPNQRFTVICLCNLAQLDPGRLARRVADVYLAEPIEAALAPYAGSYYSVDLDVEWTLRVEEAELVLVRPEDDPVPLRSEGEDVFRHPAGAELAFERDDGGRTAAFVLDAGRARGLRFVRRPARP